MKNIKYIGIPSFDQLFKSIEKNRNAETSKKYYFLIDTSFEDYHTPVSTETIWRCYNELAKYCKAQNAVLYIKLHPLSYKFQYADTENITFVRNVNHTELGRIIQGSAGVFGFYSTLTFPVAFLKTYYSDQLRRHL